jgi:hypothetical protein
MYFGDHRKDLGLLATSFVHLVPIQRLFVRVVPIQHLFPCDHNPQSRGITGLLDMKRLLFAQMGLRSNGVPLPVVKYNGVPLPFTVGVHIGAITVSTDTVQQLCHSSNLQLQKSAPCTDIHGTQGSQVQILYHKLVLWY